MYQLKPTVPIAAIDLHSHTDSAAMVAVRKEADLASPHRRIELTLGSQIRVRIAFNHLQQHRKDYLYKNNVETHYLPYYSTEKLC
jgi:hypothetical protein